MPGLEILKLKGLIGYVLIFTYFGCMYLLAWVRRDGAHPLGLSCAKIRRDCFHPLGFSCLEVAHWAFSLDY
jgi:hypothetical protein